MRTCTSPTREPAASCCASRPPRSTRALRPYFRGESATLTKVGRHLLLDLTSETEEPEDEFWEAGPLPALTPLRATLLAGDLSVAYLAWLLTVQQEEIDDDARQPRVPAGLAAPSAPVAALAAFLRLDPDLLAAAAEGSRADPAEGTDLRRWVSALPASEKERWLLRALQRPVGGELAGAYRRQRPLLADDGGRTVAELRARADALRAVRGRAEAARRDRARVAATAARRTHLGALAREGDAAWLRLDRLVGERAYEEAVQLTVDLRDAAAAAGASGEFEGRLAALKKRHSRRRGYLGAVNRALAARYPDS